MSKKENVTMNFSRENFSLKKVKLLNDSRGLNVDYSMIQKDGALSSNEKINIESHFAPHPDLTNSIEQLSEYAVKSCGLLKAVNDSKANEFNKYLNRIKEDFYPSGISLSGSEEKLGAIITGIWNCHDNYKIALNTPRIILSGEGFGFEEELSELITKIEDEVYSYLFEGKKAQLSLMDEFEDAGETESGKLKKKNSVEEIVDPNQVEIDQE